MRPRSLLRWLHGLGQSNRACRRQLNGSHAPTLRRQPYIRCPRLEPLEDRRLLSTVYVDDSATGLGNGTSWANAYASLQAALSAAVAPQEIRVAQDTYKPTLGTDRTASFVLRNGVSIYGGYAAPDPDARDVARYASILSGDVGTVGETSDNSYHVVVGSGTNSTAVLDGFTVRAGNAIGDFPNYSGGGMYNSVGSPTLSNCTFTANSASGEGGGMFNESSSPTLTNCTFTANSTGGGGGMYNSGGSAILTNCTFTANSGNHGGGMYNNSSSPTLTNCTFTDNSAYSGNGGGMYNAESSPTLTNCTFTGNSTISGSSGGWMDISGGGMYNSSSSPTLTNCTFTANLTSGEYSGGGGMFNNSSSPTLTNCTFTANSASYGGGMLNAWSSSPTLTNCILWGNTAPSGIQIDGDTGVITYCDVQGGYTGTGNIDLDPQFVRNPSPGRDDQWGTADDDYGDLRLCLASPCIDAGKNSAVPVGISTDLAGNPRFVDIPAIRETGSGAAPIVDMGAYEVPAAVRVFPGGPYRVLEGSSIALSAVGYSPALNAQPLTYAWDFDANGVFDDATGPSPTFSAAGLHAPQMLTIALRVTDASGGSGTETAVVIVAATVAYVDDTAKGLSNGTSWADAYTDLQSALAMSAPGQVIRVAQGTYKPTAGTDRTVSFALRNGVGVYGGYAGFGAADPLARNPAQYVSILSGDIGTVGGTSDNSYHVVVGSGTDATTALDGFTITAGNANGSSYYDSGGGIYNSAGSATLTNCTFAANSAYFGGGTYNESSSPTLSNCTFTANSVGFGGFGGGIYNSGGSPTLINCTFTANSANDYGSGGGIYNVSSSTLTNCTFAANSAYFGGGTYNVWSSPTLTNCTFTANSANGMHGGGMYNSAYSPTLTNCTFVANSAGVGSGGGMYNESSYPTLTNCNLWGNTAQTGGQIYLYIGTPVVKYCDIQGGYSGTGNINADPHFVCNPSPGLDGTWRTADDDYGDLRLRLTSPCIDAGQNAAVPSGITTDLAGNPRFVDVPAIADTGSGTAPIVDMGTYESPNPNLAVAGTDGPDDFLLRLTADHASIQITGPAGSNTYSVLAITSLTFIGAGGADRLTIDFANGDPLPAGGLSYDGGGGTDTLRVVASGRDVTLAATQVTVGTAAGITLSHVEGSSFDLGSGRLTKTGEGTAVLWGTSNYSGRTQVTGGTLEIANADALPHSGSLTVGSGAEFSSGALSIFFPSIATSATSPTLAIAATGKTVALARSTSDNLLSVPERIPLIVRLPRPAISLTISAANDLRALAADWIAASSIARRATANLAWLRLAAGKAGGKDQHRPRDAATLALEAVFAQFDH
jgi:autotransporter-associated beta strand protein